MENIIYLYRLRQLQLNRVLLFPITLKSLSILWFSFLDSRSVIMFFVDNQTLLPTIHDIFVWYLLAFFNWLSCTATKIFFANSQVVCIFSEISKAFWWRIRSQILALGSSTMSKFILGCRPFVAKIGNSLVEANMLLLAANSAVASLSD